MGGNMGVTLRFEDGSIEAMSRCTNPLPRFINSYGFITSNKQHLDDYMKTWYEMKDDYDRNKSTGKFEQPMTPVYAWNREKIPDEYGIVVIDYQTKTVLHSQGYTDFGQTYFGNFNHVDEEDIAALKLLVDNKMVSSVLWTYDNNEKDLAGYYVARKNAIDNAKPFEGTVEEFIAATSWDAKRNASLSSTILADGTIIFNMTPWTVTRYDESKEGLLQLKEKMSELGFIFTDSENNQWDEYIKNRFEDDEE